MALEQIFPFIFSTLWYVTCYILYYLVHGILNRGLRGVKIKCYVMMPVIIMYICIAILTGGLYFNNLIAFLLIHTFTSYFKDMIKEWSNDKKKRVALYILFLGIGTWLTGGILLNGIGLKVEAIGARFYYWNVFYNPCILAISYGALLYAECHEQVNKKINWVSGLSLYLYMITGNQMIRFYLDNDIYDAFCNIYGKSNTGCMIYVLLYALAKALIGGALSVLYIKTIGKLLDTMSKIKITSFFRKKYKGSSHYDKE